jgi:alpha-L-arabinofuranosidase
MRRGDIVEIAAQSMMIGHRWHINSIRVDPTAKTPPYFLAQGQVTMFYSLHHGREFLEVETENIPTYETLSGTAQRHVAEKVAYLDVAATADRRAIFIHAINRNLEKAMEVTMDLTDFEKVGREAVHHVFTGRLSRERGEGESREVGRITKRPLQLEGKLLRLALPAPSVSIVEIARE